MWSSPFCVDFLKKIRIDVKTVVSCSLLIVWSDGKEIIYKLNFFRIQEPIVCHHDNDCDHYYPHRHHHDHNHHQGKAVGWFVSESSHCFSEIPSTQCAPGSKAQHCRLFMICSNVDHQNVGHFESDGDSNNFTVDMIIDNHRCDIKSSSSSSSSLQVYTGGVFSPMSEDGSDYQQMDSFQV